MGCYMFPWCPMKLSSLHSIRAPLELSQAISEALKPGESFNSWIIAAAHEKLKTGCPTSRPVEEVKKALSIVQNFISEKEKEAAK